MTWILEFTERGSGRWKISRMTYDFKRRNARDEEVGPQSMKWIPEEETTPRS